MKLDFPVLRRGFLRIFFKAILDEGCHHVQPCPVTVLEQHAHSGTCVYTYVYLCVYIRVASTPILGPHFAEYMVSR